MLRNTNTMVSITRLPAENQEGYHHGGHRGLGEQSEKDQAYRQIFTSRSFAYGARPSTHPCFSKPSSVQSSASTNSRRKRAG
jgi:hypothetical protein